MAGKPLTEGGGVEAAERRAVVRGPRAPLGHAEGAAPTAQRRRGAGRRRAGGGGAAARDAPAPRRGRRAPPMKRRTRASRAARTNHVIDRGRPATSTGT